MSGTLTDTWEQFPFLLSGRRDNAAEYLPATGSVPASGMPAIWVWGGRQDGDTNVLISAEPPLRGDETGPAGCRRGRAVP